MSGSTVLSRLGIRIGVCGDDTGRLGHTGNSSKGRSNNDAYFKQTSCSYPVFNIGNGSMSPPNHSPHGGIMKAWEAAMMAENNNAYSNQIETRSRPLPRDSSALTVSRSEEQKDRVRSLRPQDSCTTAKIENRTKKMRKYGDFILPQYVGRHYEENALTDTPENLSQKSHTESPKKSYRHIGWLPHGTVTTGTSLLLAWLGFGLALISRQSLKFVRLTTHWHISEIYEDVQSLGIVHAGICFNETLSTIEDASKVGCFTVPLATNDDMDDPMLKVSAVFSSIAVVLGFLLTLCTSALLLWRTVNFRALGFFYIILYVFQSLSFLFFDTDICEFHECKIDIGCMYCIASSVCWFSSSILCAKMESNRLKSDVAEERKRRKAEASKAALRQNSLASQTKSSILSDRTSSFLSEEVPPDIDEENPVSQKYAAESGIAKQHNSIITLYPGNGNSGETVISELTKTSTVNTLNNREHGRLEYQGKEVSKRGRSRSKSRIHVQGRSMSRERSRSKSRVRERSRSAIRTTNRLVTPEHTAGEKAQHTGDKVDLTLQVPVRGRSKSRGRSSSKSHVRPRSTSKSAVNSGNQHGTTVSKPNRRMRDNKDHKSALTPQVQSVRYSSRAFRGAPISPIKKKNDRTVPKNDDYVTSYFDI